MEEGLAFLFVLIPVFFVTGILRAIFALPTRVISGSWQDNIFCLLAAHALSLFIVGFMSTIGFGAADFPTMNSLISWSLVFAGPSQAFLFLVDLGFYFWIRHMQQPS